MAKRVNPQRMFPRWLSDMRSRNPETAEAGFWAIAEFAPDLVAELLEAFENETDHGTRCWLLELLSEAKDETLLPVFEQALDDASESIRDWAVRGLKELDTKDARRLLWQRGLN